MPKLTLYARWRNRWIARFKQEMQAGLFPAHIPWHQDERALREAFELQYNWFAVKGRRSREDIQALRLFTMWKAEDRHAMLVDAQQYLSVLVHRDPKFKMTLSRFVTDWHVHEGDTWWRAEVTKYPLIEWLTP